MNQSVQVITHFVSPYQVELFNAVAETGAVDLFVAYLHDTWRGRHWEQVSMRHAHRVLGDPAARAEALDRLDEADLVIFNFYRDRFVRRLIRRRAGGDRPWAFWGERPAFRLKGPLGTLYRRWCLAPLVKSAAPIWGIGSWATEKYRREFGPRRRYCELPYYSDLTRFRRPAGIQPARGGGRRFLFSGSLTARKGIDLLAAAFQGLARRRSNVHLTIIGSGELEASLRRDLRGLEHAVSFAGFQAWEQLPRWYHEADVLVAPSRYDGWGLIIPEGLAAGLPVIATDRMGAAVDLVSDGRNGWICGAGDVGGLASCLDRLAVMPDRQLDEHKKLAEASVSGHQLSHGADRFVQLCHDVLRTWSPRNARSATVTSDI